VPSPGDPQSLNRYAYVRNNPLKYTDPSGHFANVIVGAAIGAVIGAAVSAGPQIIQNAREGQPLTTNIDPGEVAKAAAVGAVGGAVAGATFGLALAAAPAVGLGTGLGAHVAAGAASGVVAGQASRAMGNALEGQGITQGLGNPGEMARDAVVGGTLGAAGYGIAKGIQSWRAARGAIHYTQEGDEFIHYGFARHAESFEGGVRPGGYATPSDGTIMTARTATQRLALPRSAPPDSYYVARPALGTPIQGPRRVLPILRFEGWHPIFRIGLGREVIFPQGTRAGSVLGPYGLPE